MPSEDDWMKIDTFLVLLQLGGNAYARLKCSFSDSRQMFQLQWGAGLFHLEQIGRKVPM